MAATAKAKTNASLFDSNYDWGLLTIVISLLAFGLVMVFSSSYSQGISGFNNPYYFILRQLIWTGIGLTVMAITASIRYTLWESWSIVLMAGTLLGLLMVLPFGSDLYGASRTFFNGSIQPSEPAKLVIIMYISTWLASKGSRIRDVRVGLIPFSILMGFITVLIVFQPDISSAFLIVATALILFFIAGADLKQLLLIGSGTALTFWIVIRNSVYAQARVDKYLASIWNPLESEEWQVRHSVIALTNGGPTGVGVGQGEVYVPLSWSDYIFATIGEEMGLIGALLVVLLFALFAYRGLRTALNAPDNFGMLLATGITSILIMQALLNVAVVVAAAPPTGVTLPFISYGGSSLVTTLAAVGILLSISRHSNDQQSSKKASKPSEIGKLAYARFDFGWGNRRSRVSSARRSSPVKKAVPQKNQLPQKRQQPNAQQKQQPENPRQDEPLLPNEQAAVEHQRTSQQPNAKAAVDLLWIGSSDGMEKELVTHAGIDYFGISAGKFRVNPLVALSSVGKLFSGFWQSWQKIAKFRPDVCLVTGGYVCPPVVAVCWLKRIPVLVYLPDMTPGWAIRGLSYPAKRVAISFPSVAHFFGGEVPQGKAVVTGYPVRAELVEAATDRAAARTQLASALDRPSLAEGNALTDSETVPIVLIWGGSQGSRSINRATWAMLREALPHAHIVHVVGSRDWALYAKEAEADVQALPDKLRKRYHPVAYLHSEMTLALAAADVSIARAGASTLGEFPVAKLPSILVPLPFAGVNQASNADELEKRGGAVVVQDEDLSTALAPTLLALLANAEERKEMESSLGKMAMPDAALKIAQLIVKMS